METKSASPNLELAFDVGHSSLGWAVLESSLNSQPVRLRRRDLRSRRCLASKRRLLRAHFGKLRKVDSQFEQALMGDWKAIPVVAAGHLV